MSDPQVEQDWVSETETPIADGWTMYSAQLRSQALIPDQVMDILKTAFYGGAIWHRTLAREDAAALAQADAELEHFLDALD